MNESRKEDKKRREKKKLEELAENKTKLEAEENKLANLRQLEDQKAKKADKLVKETSEKLTKRMKN